ncbi:MAG: acetyl-CoA carboxylase biotin carboxyl carrier protein [Planctomycetota bacterium]|jgi:acetyl-CoA carboxylase biotin carboxyl carrier protein
MAQKKKPAKKTGTKSPKKPSAGSAAKKPAGKKAGAKKPAAKKPASKRAGASGVRGADPVAQIQRVIDVMVEAGAVEVELEDAGLKLRVRLKGDVPMPMMSYAAPAPAAVMGPAPAAPAGEAAAPAASAPAADDPRRKVFQSPMVGTFYRSSSPDSDPFVGVGDRVGPDQTICILEAMKVMNEIKAEMSGEIVEVLVQNGEPVEFGQPLFVIKAD